jgi:hypothetical protein
VGILWIEVRRMETDKVEIGGMEMEMEMDERKTDGEMEGKAMKGIEMEMDERKTDGEMEGKAMKGIEMEMDERKTDGEMEGKAMKGIEMGSVVIQETTDPFSSKAWVLA